MSFESSPPPSRVRVPPPPPPGFGDEEYYRLYGRPEEYHRYRERLEREGRDNRNYKQSDRPLPPGPPSYIHEGPPGRPPRRAPPPPGHDHEEYYYYRSYRRSPRHAFEYEDPEFDYSSNGISGNKIRRAPPPQPPPARRDPVDGSPFYESNSHSEYEQDGDEFVPRRNEAQSNSGYGKDFENFRVTIKNAHSRRRSNTDKASRKTRGRSMDGTPSLSGVDDEDIDEYDDDSCYEDTLDEDSEDEESKQRRQRHRRGGGGEGALSDETRSPSLPKTESKKKGSIKDRLGSRVPVRPPSPPDSPPERQRRAPPLTPPYKKYEEPLESSNSKRKRPPSPISPPHDCKKERSNKNGGPFEQNERIQSNKTTIKNARGKDQGVSSTKPKQRKANDSAKRARSPRNKANKRNARSWSSGRDNLGSRYGNRSPTPLPGTPRRVREQRAREAAAKESKGKNTEKEKRKSNPIYGKSKMRMDKEHKNSNQSRDRSNDKIRNKERPQGRDDNSRSRKSRTTRNSKDERTNAPYKKEKTYESTRSRINSGGFGKGVINKGRDRKTSGGNRPPTPVPIGSKSQSKGVRKNIDKQKAKSRENKDISPRQKKPNKEETTKENEMMLRRLARKRKGMPQSSESDKNLTLAKMAGIEIPIGTSGLTAQENGTKHEMRENSLTYSEKSDMSSRDSEEESASRSVSRSPERKGRKRDWKSGKRGMKDVKGRKSQRNQHKKGPKAIDSRSGSNSGRDDRSRSKSSRSKGDKASLQKSKKVIASGEQLCHCKVEEMNSKRMNNSNNRESLGKRNCNQFNSFNLQTIKKEAEIKGGSTSAVQTTTSRGEKRSKPANPNYNTKLESKRYKDIKHPDQQLRSRSRRSSQSSTRSISTASSSSTGSIHRERRRERKKISRKDRLKISAENSSVVQAATRASQAIMHRQHGNTNIESQAQSIENVDALKSTSNSKVTNEQVNMGLSGKLLEETNTVNGVVVKYSEPPEARKPKTRWRLYVFKGNEELPILYIHRQSAYLLGRDRKVADIPLDHPSCSKQHAALQYRLVDYTRSDGSKSRRVTPYVIDLNSANGTYVNNQKIESQKFVSLKKNDVVKFGLSSRKYVLFHDQTKEGQDNDTGIE